MAIFERGSETIEIYPAKWGKDEFGNDVVLDADPSKDTPIIRERCIVQPMTESVDTQYGYSILSVYRILLRDWPTQAKAIVRWDGRLWDVKENAARRRYSPGVKHDTVYIHAREEEMHP